MFKYASPHLTGLMHMSEQDAGDQKAMADVPRRSHAGCIYHMNPSQLLRAPLQVHVQRRETERQQESRLNSYAFLTEREQQEPWRELHAIPPRPNIVDAMLYAAVDAAVPMSLSQQDYSCAILPGETSHMLHVRMSSTIIAYVPHTGRRSTT